MLTACSASHLSFEVGGAVGDDADRAAMGAWRLRRDLEPDAATGISSGIPRAPFWVPDTIRRQRRSA